MHEELIRDLRICKEGKHCDKCDFYELKRANGLCACTGELCRQAADAIHQLSYHAHDWEKIADHWRKKYEELERQIREET